MRKHFAGETLPHIVLIDPAMPAGAVLTRVQATDADAPSTASSQIRYSLIGYGEDLLIDSITGVLSTKRDLRWGETLRNVHIMVCAMVYLRRNAFSFRHKTSAHHHCPLQRSFS